MLPKIDFGLFKKSKKRSTSALEQELAQASPELQRMLTTPEPVYAKMTDIIAPHFIMYYKHDGIGEKRVKWNIGGNFVDIPKKLYPILGDIDFLDCLAAGSPHIRLDDGERVDPGHPAYPKYLFAIMAYCIAVLTECGLGAAESIKNDSNQDVADSLSAGYELETNPERYPWFTKCIMVFSNLKDYCSSKRGALELEKYKIKDMIGLILGTNAVDFYTELALRDYGDTLLKKVNRKLDNKLQKLFGRDDVGDLAKQEALQTKLDEKRFKKIESALSDAQKSEYKSMIGRTDSEATAYKNEYWNKHKPMNENTPSGDADTNFMKSKKIDDVRKQSHTAELREYEQTNATTQPDDAATREQTTALLEKLDQLIDSTEGVKQATVDAGEGTTARINGAKNEAIAYSASYTNDVATKVAPKPKPPSLKPPVVTLNKQYA